ncbi:hypothetical protein [Micromonospora siamensis]|uniref:Protein phosphatase 2C n=1 Tax=Micromonospora siamensis TaxID=299152 RepID=A0A1C5GVU6_9ACTN|nr:hypothetical protein [Micromonospora siamensis]SCG37926.1 hypothetical protein GA0074704_0594 [Micromonospora siamensis]
MRVRLATEAAPGRPANEDAALHVGSLVGVFDGVTAPRDRDSGCVHGPAWYVQRLTSRLAQVAGEEAAAGLPDLLAEAIERVRVDHDGRCDLDNPATPAATVCLLRPSGDQLDYLILSDCTLVVDQGDTVTVLTDQRFGIAVAELRREALALHGTELPAGRPTPGKYELTNQPHGYWIAAANPEAARQAVTGALDLHGPQRVRRAALLTDGTSCAVDEYQLMDWQQLLDVLTEYGPCELIRRVRHAENADPTGADHPRYKRHDDATAALCIFEEHP